MLRTVYPEAPPHVEYTLTSLGYTILDAMWAWSEGYQARGS